jgi:hypothetical protein
MAIGDGSRPFDPRDILKLTLVVICESIAADDSWL